MPVFPGNAIIASADYSGICSMCGLEMKIGLQWMYEGDEQSLIPPPRITFFHGEDRGAVDGVYSAR